jgi:hypothetical protein
MKGRVKKPNSPPPSPSPIKGEGLVETLSVARPRGITIERVQKIIEVKLQLETGKKYLDKRQAKLYVLIS